MKRRTLREIAMPKGLPKTQDLERAQRELQAIQIELQMARMLVNMPPATRSNLN